MKKTTKSITLLSKFKKLRMNKNIMFCLILAMAFPALAQDAANDNILTRYAWHIVHFLFYGFGGVIAFVGIAVPIGKKALGIRSETNPVVGIVWALLFFAAPSLLEYGIKWFKADSSVGQMLDGIETDFDLNN